MQKRNVSVGGKTCSSVVQKDIIGENTEGFPRPAHKQGFYCLTHVSPTGLDDDGTAAARLLLCLSHALPGLLVRVVRGTHRNLILDPSQAVQLYAPFTEETRRGR